MQPSSSARLRQAKVGAVLKKPTFAWRRQTKYVRHIKKLFRARSLSMKAVDIKNFMYFLLEPSAIAKMISIATPALQETSNG